MSADLRERVARALALKSNGSEMDWEDFLPHADAVLAELGLTQAEPVALTEPERKAIDAAMQNAEHEAGDVEDVCPWMEDDEDAYWAWHKYHGLRKLLAAPHPHPQASPQAGANGDSDER